MTAGDRSLNVAIPAVPAATAFTLYGMLDLLSSPGRDWPFIIKREICEARMWPYVVARSVENFRAINEVWSILTSPDMTVRRSVDEGIQLLRFATKRAVSIRTAAFSP